MKILYILISTLLFYSCASSFKLVPTEDLKGIEVGTRRIDTQVHGSSQMELMKTVARTLAREGFAVRTDNLAMQVSTEPRSIQGGTSIKLMVNIDTLQSVGSVASFSGEWGLNLKGQTGMAAIGAHGMSGTQRIIYEGSAKIPHTKMGVAFQRMLLVTREIPNAIYSYHKK